jgi:hypothetical protein
MNLVDTSMRRPVTVLVAMAAPRQQLPGHKNLVGARAEHDSRARFGSKAEQYRIF